MSLKSVLFTLLCIFMLSCATMTLANDFIDDFDLEEAVTIAEEELYQSRHQLSKMNQGIQQQQQNLAKSQEKEQKLYQELNEINQKIIRDSKKLVAMYKEMKLQKQKTFEKKEALETINAEKKTLALQTQKRLAAYYRMGKIGVLNITFTSSSLPDLVNFHEYYRYMLRQDQELINTFRLKLTELQQARQSHINEVERLETALKETKQQQIILSSTRKERYKIIEQIQIEQSLYKEATSQLEQSAQTLILEIEALEKKRNQAKQKKEAWLLATYPLEPHKKRKPAWLRGIVGYQKQLPPPIIGIVTKRFTGNRTSAITPNYGINFKIAAGSKIRAVFKGKIVHTGYVKGYGQLVIISHSDGYYTLTSSISTITVKKGDSVEQGDEIGFMSQHRSQLQQDLHFEIRFKETPLDPLDWLDSNYIILSQELEARHQNL